MTENEAKEVRDLERKILSVESEVLLRLTAVETTIHSIREQINTYVTKERFEPVAYIAYGLAAGVLTTFLGALIAQVITK